MSAEFKSLYTRLKRYASRYLSTPEDAEDITQEACLKVLEAGSKGKIEQPEAYLFRTTRNLALNKLARNSRLAFIYIEDLADSSVIEEGLPLEEEIFSQKRFERFCTALVDLPDQCRRVVILRKVYGYSHQQVAKKLNISISTVEKHLSKGLIRCAIHMEKQESSGIIKLNKSNPAARCQS